MPRKLMLLVLLLIFSFSGAAFAQETPIPTTPVQPSAPPTDLAISAGDQAIIDAAQAATQRADDMIATSNLVLNFMEVLAGLATLVLAVGAIFGFRSIAELRNDTKKIQEEFTQRLNDEMAAISKEREAIQQMTRNIDDALKDVRNRGDNAIRALTLVQLGEQQMNESNWTAAMRTFQEACDLDAENRAVNYYLGELFIMERQLEKAEGHLRKAQDKNAVFPPAEAALAYVLRLQGDKETDLASRNEYYSSAERRFLKALRYDHYVQDINGESVNGMLGALYRQWGRIEEAIQSYERAAALTPNRPYPVNNLAILHYRSGNLEQAARCFQQTMRLADQRIFANPADYYAHFDRINGLIALGQTEAARAELDIVLPQTRIRGPLESFRNGLKMLANSLQPPDDIRTFINRVERALETVEATEYDPSIDPPNLSEIDAD